MEYNIIYNEDCLSGMKNHLDDKSINVILTSPPYNMTKRKGGYGDTGRYDVYTDWKEESEYIEWIKDIFNEFDRVLANNGTILFNFSYSIENPSLPYKLVNYLESNTNFTLIDTIIWKKNSGLPYPANSRRLCRIWEFVFVFVRKEERDTFITNRKLSKVGSNGQKYYEIDYNYIQAKNNDEKCDLNQATFSTELVEKLLNMYSLENDVVLDPFMGSGTTAVACKKLRKSYIGFEISEKQVEYSLKRLSEDLKQDDVATLFDFIEGE